MIRNYLKIAWRNLIRTKVYSFINISGLSIGLACCMLIILFNMDEVSFDRFHSKAKNIYRITSTSIGADGKIENASGITGMMPGPAFKREIPEVKEFVRLQGEQLPVKIGTKIFDQEALRVDDNFFSVFTFPLLYGNKNTVLKDIHSVVLSEEVAKKFFGTSNAIGKVIQLPKRRDHDDAPADAFDDFIVSGIVQESPQNSSIKIRMLLPMASDQINGGDTQWLNFFLNTFVVLDDHANIKTVEAKFKRVFEADAKDQIKESIEKYNNKSTFIFGLQPLLDMHLSEKYQPDNGLTDGSTSTKSQVLFGIALFILIIACINFVNLSVARSLKRAKEIGIRKVIGGKRKQLIAQFLGESFLLSFFSFALAILIVFALLPFFNSAVNKSLSFSYLLNAKLVIIYIGLFIVTSLFAGFYPALVLSGFDPVKTLYSRTPALGKNYLSKGLIILQFSLATFLIIATVTIYKQSEYLSNFDLGYNDKNLVIINTDRMKTDKFLLFKNELMKDPNIISVAARQRGQWGTIAKVDGNQIDFAFDIIDTGFLSTIHVPIIEGRNLSSLYPSDSTQSVLVNQAFVDKAGWKDIRNKQVDFFYDTLKYNVVGVVKDYHFESLMNKVKPQLFTMNPRYGYGQLFIKIRPQHTSETLKNIEKIVKAQQPYIPYKYDFKDVSNTEQYAAEQKSKQIISFSAVLTIFISCIGLFGLATLAAEKRTKEVGIRKVLGASATAITRILSVSFLKLVLLSTLIAFPAAWWAMNKWLQDYPYRIHIGIWEFVFAGFIVSIVALITVSSQAIKKAIANPIQSLRTE